MREAGAWRRRAWWISAVLVFQALAVLLYLRVERAREIGRAARLQYESLSAELPIDLRLQRPDDTTLELSDLRGRHVLLHFWATWCPPCREELPALLETSRRLAREGRVSLVAVSLDDDWAVVRDYFDGEIPPEVYRDDADSRSQLDIWTLPETFLLQSDGRPTLRFAGAREWRAPAAVALLRDHTIR